VRAVSRRITVCVVASVVAAGLAVTHATGASATSAAFTTDPDPAPVVAHPVPVPPTAPHASDATDPAWLNPGVSVPAAGAAVVDVPATGKARAGTLPVFVARAAAGTNPGRVRVRLLSQAQVTAAGGRFVGFELTRADGGASAAHLALTVDYSGVARAYGGDFASRLRLIRAPQCDPDSRCDTATVPSTNDATAMTLTVSDAVVEPDPLAVSTSSENVATAPSPDSGFGPQLGSTDLDSTSSALSAFAPTSTTYVATASAAGPNGDYSATPLAASDRWDVGIGSGAFTYSYPIGLPPPPAGAAPDLSLDYSSQAVDGRTVVENGQAPQVGEGWSFEPGFIERKFHSCYGENQTFDQCWTPYNQYFLHFGGHSGELLRSGSTNEWRLRGNDPGFRVLSFTSGGGNGDNDGEYFVVITPDGTRYWFGYGVEPRNATTTYTNSAFEVPVVGGPGEPCHTSLISTSWCYQTYRWNVDRIVDTNDNVTSLFYTKEYNRYARNKTSAWSTQYVSAGQLEHIEYGQRNGAEGTTAPAKVTVATQYRCGSQAATCPAPTPGTTGSYPDVPRDLICGPTTLCDPVTQNAPSFWSGKEITSVDTFVWNRTGTSPNYTYAYTDVASYDMTYSFPATGDSSTPSLWLKDITKTGLYGTHVTLPSVQFAGHNLPNRADAGTPSLYKFRVDTITSELGGRIVVTYGTPNPCTNPVQPWESNTTDCYPEWYDPHDPAIAAAWVTFQKYLVTQTSTQDMRGGQPTRTTTYSYLDTPAWHYDDSVDPAVANNQSWSDYRGHSWVKVVVSADGTTARTETRYHLFRGMDGDKLSGTTHKDVTLSDATDPNTAWHDYNYLAGQQLEVEHFDEAGTSILSDTIHRYSAVTTVTGPAGFQPHNASYVREVQTLDRTTDLTPSAPKRVHEKRMTYDDTTNMLLTVSDDGMPGDASDDTCTTTQYNISSSPGTNGSDSAWLVDRPFRVVTADDPCEAAVRRTVAETELYYDNHVFNSPPSSGNITTSLAYTANGVYARTTMTYDALGRMTSTIAPNENAHALPRAAATTAYAPSTGYPYDGVTATDAMGNATTTYLYPMFGTPSRVVDANLQPTLVYADALGRTVKVVRPLDGATPSYEFVYDVNSGAPARVKTSRASSGATNGVVVSYAFLDGFGRTFETQQMPPNGTGTNYRTTVTRYDAQGNKAAETQPMDVAATTGHAFGQAPVNPALASIPYETRYEYDALGRVDRSVSYALGGPKYATNTTYHGLFYTIDPEVHSDTDYYTDVFGRTTKVVERPGSGTISTNYTYTPLGDLASITDTAGNVTSYGYDWLRHRTSSVDPDQGSSTTSYDDDGNVLEAVDGGGTRLHYGYDANDRKKSVSVGTTTANPIATWTYDDAALGKGLPGTSTRIVGGESYTTAVTAYDGRGRPLGKRLSLPTSLAALGAPYTTTYTYDQSSNVTSVTMPAVGALTQETVTTTYNGAGLPNAMTSQDGTYIAGTTYRGDGRLDSRALRGVNDITRAYAYEANLGRLSSIITTITGVTDPVERLSYGYDGDSNVTSVTDLAAGAGGFAQRECFVYDPLNRLTRAVTTKSVSASPTTDCPDAAHPSTVVDPTFGVDGYDASYAYDNLGNMTSATLAMGGTTKTQTYTYPPAGSARPHAVSTVTPPVVAGGSTAYTYDGNGQTLTRPDPHAKTLVWDELHQLRSTSGTDPLDAESFLYDADGQRLIRNTSARVDATTTSATTTLYLDGAELAITTTNPATTTTTKATRYYGSVAMRTRSTGDTASTVVTLLRNQQNSTATSISSTNAPTRQLYLPYGALRTAGITTTDRGFLDKTRDPSGLVQMGARYYDPSINRFLSVDAVVDDDAPQTLAGYSYALNNPATFLDPSGLSAIGADEAGGGPGCEIDCGSEESTHQWRFGEFQKNVWNGVPTRDEIIKGVVWTPNERALLSGSFQTSPCFGVDRSQCGGNIAIVFDCQMSGGSGCYAKGVMVKKAGSALAALLIMGLAHNLQKSLDATGAAFDAAPDPTPGLSAEDCGANSFVGATPVLLADGSKKSIRNIRVGEFVLAGDGDNGSRSGHEVLHVIRHHDRHVIVEVTLDDGTSLKATDGHPFWDAGSHAFKYAADLRPGDSLVTAGGNLRRVSAVRHFSAVVTAYNLNVSRVHTYFAGATPVLVHNSCDINDPPSFQGSSRGEAEAELRQAGWAEDGPTRSGGGVRWRRPGNISDQVRIMPGDPLNPNPLKQGPYIRLSISGNKWGPYPLSD
jgi:RHS repeat-associated protein